MGEISLCLKRKKYVFCRPEVVILSLVFANSFGSLTTSNQLFLSSNGTTRGGPFFEMLFLGKSSTVAFSKGSPKSVVVALLLRSMLSAFAENRDKTPRIHRNMAADDDAQTIAFINLQINVNGVWNCGKGENCHLNCNH